jgi:hypothetical protein
VNVSVGTSGYSYKAWLGSFYPKNLSPKEMLRFYASRLRTVEINNTFYRLPKESVLLSWAQQVPDGFRFVLKAPQKITHVKRLKDTGAEVEYLFRAAAALGPKLGAILFQLPPNLHKDLSRLQSFLSLMPHDRRIALEFRHSHGSMTESSLAYAREIARSVWPRRTRANLLNSFPPRRGATFASGDRNAVARIYCNGRNKFCRNPGIMPTYSSSMKMKRSVPSWQRNSLSFSRQSRRNSLRAPIIEPTVTSEDSSVLSQKFATSFASQSAQKSSFPSFPERG